MVLVHGRKPCGQLRRGHRIEEKGTIMAFLTIHRMEGDPDALLRKKQEKFDPTVKEFAGQHGAVFSVTAKTAQGLVVVNVWQSAEAAIGFAQLPQIQQVQRESGLPMPSSFERYADAQRVEYQR
jgi:hypothetical protein